MPSSAFFTSFFGTTTAPPTTTFSSASAAIASLPDVPADVPANIASSPPKDGPSAPTFFVSDRRMLAHKCEWDPAHIDAPNRLDAVLAKLEKEQVLDQCQLLDPAECSNADLRLVHSQEHIDSIREASALPELAQMEHFCAAREDIYVNQHSWDCALLSAGSALKAMESVLGAAGNTTPGQPAPNAFAAIRPPGHHASRDAPCGFCLFNNVAICAKKARKMGLERVLIVDWDVHAGQGTQYSVEGDPGILLVSIHRYEQGQFWPELPESGILSEYQNTINVPLDELGYGDAEYAALMHFLVLPLIQQWQPQLILVSCGFDAGLGDPQGEMEVSPAGFGYMTGLLASLGIPLCMVLEGGYFLHSVVQGTLSCVRALLQRSPPMLDFCQRLPAPLFLRTLYTVLLTRSQQFPLLHEFTHLLNRLRLGRLSPKDRRKRLQLSPIRMPTVDKATYLGDRRTTQLQMATHTYPTRGLYPAREPAVEQHFLLRVHQLLDAYANGPPERALLDLELGPGGRVLIVPAARTGNNKKELFRLHGPSQLLLFYFYLLLPMDFTFFDVRISQMKLPLTGAQLAALVAKLEVEEKIPITNGCDNGHGHDHGSGDGESMLDLERILDSFAQMKPLFLF